MNKRRNIIRLLIIVGFLKSLSVGWQHHIAIQDDLKRIHIEQTETKKELQYIHNELNKKEKQLQVQINKNEEVIKELKSTNRGATRELNQTFIATAYTNSKDENGKWGAITKSGIKLDGNMDISSRIIAVDPNVIPLKSEVYIEFPSPYEYLNGIWFAEDSGSSIKSNRIDIFVGNSKKQAFEFGKREIKVKYIVNNK